MAIREFLFPLICFGYGGEDAESGGEFAGVNEGGVVVGRGDVLRVAEPAKYEYSMELEGVEGLPGVQWGGGVAWTDVRHIV